MKKMVYLSVILFCLISFAFAQDAKTGRTITKADKQTTKPSITDYTKLTLLKTLKVNNYFWKSEKIFINAIAFSPDGKIIASVNKTLDQRGKLALWDVDTGKMIMTVPENNGFDSVAFSPNNNVVATGGGDVNLWSIKTGKRLRKFKFEEGSSIAFSPDGKMIASGGTVDSGCCEGEPPGLVRIWNLQTNKLIKEIQPELSNGVWSVIFSPNGSILLGDSSDIFSSDILMWNTKNWSLIRKIEVNFDIQSLAFSPDGKTIAGSGGTFNDETEEKSGDVRLWNTVTGKPLRSFSGHTDYVNLLAFSPDGNTIATGSNDNTIKLWDAQTGKLLKTLIKEEGNNPFLALVFSPDGKILAGGDSNGLIRIWKITE